MALDTTVDVYVLWVLVQRKDNDTSSRRSQLGDHRAG
ncbi:hypothetical protein PI125_g4651 [Phytophthora idaei]|nr:hypothetical protein PI125_g4651 [Phytophthora idaei]